jgi:hypothetical protein
MLGMNEVEKALVSRGSDVELFWGWIKLQMSRSEYNKILDEEPHHIRMRKMKR